MTDVLRQIEELSIQLKEIRNRQSQMTNEIVGMERQLSALRSSVISSAMRVT
jgi:predicted  nucleic acid-binding Zn-ribbon protein